MCCFRPVKCLTRILIFLLVIVLLIVGIFIALIFLTPRSLGIADKTIYSTLTFEDLGIADMSIWDTIMLYRASSSNYQFETPSQMDRDSLKDKLSGTSIDYENASDLFNVELMTESGAITLSGTDMAIIFDSIATDGNILQDLSKSGVGIGVANTEFFSVQGKDSVRVVLMLDISKYKQEIAKVAFLKNVISDIIWVKLNYDIASDNGRADASFSGISINGLTAEQSAIFLNALYAITDQKSETSPQNVVSLAGKNVLDRVFNNIGQITEISNDRVSFLTKLITQ